jgi:hypothetical protein
MHISLDNVGMSIRYIPRSHTHKPYHRGRYNLNKSASTVNTCDAALDTNPFSCNKYTPDMFTNMLLYNVYFRIRPVCSFELSPASSSSSSSSLSSLQPSSSSPSPRMPKLMKKPSNEIPAKMPNGSASPLGCILVATVNREPETNGPAARPAAESVCARPLRVPRTLWFGAELVI